MAATAPAPSPVGGASALHALQFRVMRLCRPTLDVERPLRFALDDLGHDGDDALPLGVAASLSEGGAPPEAFERRLDLVHPEHASGVSGMLVLPQSFGNIYLGETFTSYVSAGNHSDRAVRDAGFKAELQTERQRLILFDNTAAPLPVLQPGECYDFTVEHDLKELGAHTLVCSTVYTDADGERKYLPQYFKFAASNPLAVRTKVRPGRDGRTLLEACVENATRTPLLLASATFDPSPRLRCETLAPPAVSATAAVFPEPGSCQRGAPDARGAGMGLPSLSGRAMHVLAPSGGSAHFLFELRPDDRGDDAAATTSGAGDAGEPLGKLEIRWKGRMGEAGRLQTQQIMGPPRPRRDVEITVAPSLPTTATLARPLSLRCVIRNCAATATAPLELVARDGWEDPGADAGAGTTGKNAAPPLGMAVDGPRAVSLGVLEPGGEATAEVTVVPLAPGTRRLPMVEVRDAGGRLVSELKPWEVMVEREVETSRPE